MEIFYILLSPPGEYQIFKITGSVLYFTLTAHLNLHWPCIKCAVATVAGGYSVGQYRCTVFTRVGKVSGSRHIAVVVSTTFEMILDIALDPHSKHT
jgi:hypothetical protein